MKHGKYFRPKTLDPAKAKIQINFSAIFYGQETFIDRTIQEVKIHLILTNLQNIPATQ